MRIYPATLSDPPLYSTADIRRIEACARVEVTAPGLMARAGACIAKHAESLADDTGAPILVRVGPGNNGGDALLAALLLRQRGFRVFAVAGPGAPHTAEVARACAAWREADESLHSAPPATGAFGLDIDGVFGIALQRDVEGPVAGWLENVNTFAALGWRSMCPVVSTATPAISGAAPFARTAPSLYWGPSRGC